MKIKTKIALGIAFLFIVILSLVVVSGYSLYKLSNDSSAIIKDNYESVQYSKNMLNAIDEIKSIQAQKFLNPGKTFDDKKYGDNLAAFEKNLSAEEHDITEPGEGDFASALRTNSAAYFNLFSKIRKDSSFSPEVYPAQILPAYQTVKGLITQVMDVNLQAMIRKNNQAQHTANQAIALMAIFGTLILILALTFSLNFPGYIANPIRELTEGIKQIAEKNYSQSLHFESNDEFGELAAAFNSMALKLNEYENTSLAETLFEKKRIETIINNMRDAIIGLDENLEILFVNNEASKMLGMHSLELTGKYAPDMAILNDLLRSLIKDIVDRVDGSKPVEKQKPMRIVVDGKEAFFNKDILDVKAEGGGDNAKLIGYVIILKDITQYYELDSAKTNFIATISHELKTPISSINMSIKLLEDTRIGDMNPEQHKLIDNVKDETGRILKITSELLDLAQVETGNLQLHYQDVNPVEIISFAYEALKFQAEQKNVKIEISTRGLLPKVKVDVEKTTWVMINLIANALRYSGEMGKILVDAQEKNGFVEFSVKDFGPGIDEKYRDKVFDKFFKVPGAENSKSGTGLGLAISKEFIIAQGGRIWVESELGKGSRFIFALPCK